MLLPKKTKHRKVRIGKTAVKQLVAITSRSATLHCNHNQMSALTPAKSSLLVRR